MQYHKYTYCVSAMDCPAEEALIRAVLKPYTSEILRLRFDLRHRQVIVISSFESGYLAAIIGTSGLKTTFVRGEAPTVAELVPDMATDDVR